MRKMILLKNTIGSVVIIAACPKCYRIGWQYLRKPFSSLQELHLRSRYVCPVCHEEYDECTFENVNDYAEAYEKYKINSEQYNADVLDIYKKEVAYRNGVTNEHETKRLFENDSSDIETDLIPFSKTPSVCTNCGSGALRRYIKKIDVRSEKISLFSYKCEACNTVYIQEALMNKYFDNYKSKTDKDKNAIANESNGEQKESINITLFPKNEDILILSKIINSVPFVWKDKRLFRALLLDYFPQDKFLRNILLTSVDEKIPEFLSKTIILRLLDLHRLAKILVAVQGCTNEIGISVILLWIQAMDVDCEFTFISKK